LERLEELKEAKIRLWLLVSELLLKKQKLRTQLPQRDSLRELHLL